MNHFVLLGILSTCILWTVSKGFEPPYIDCSSRTVYVINETVPDTLKKDGVFTPNVLNFEKKYDFIHCRPIKRHISGRFKAYVCDATAHTTDSSLTFRTLGDIVLSVKGLKDFQKDNCEVFDFIERKGDNMTLKEGMSSFCVQNAASCGSVSCFSVDNVNIKFPVRWTISRELEYNISTNRLEYEAHVRELTAEDTHVPLNGSIQIVFKDCHGKGFGNPRLQLEQNTSTVPFSWGAVTNFDSLKVAGLIDYEVQTEYLLTLRIVYQEFHATATTTIKVIVEDVDDNKPRFNLTDVDAHYVLNIPENNQSLVNVPLPVEPPIYAYDPDFGINMTIWYSIIDQDKDGLFVIDPDSGDLNVTRALNRSEVDDFYKIFIEAVQTDNPNRAAYAWVKVNVLDIDDHLPHFKSDAYHFNIAEHAPSGTEIALLHVIDPDEGDNALFSCKFFNDSLPLGVEVVPDGCRIIVNDSVKFDREAYPNGVMQFEIGAMATLRGELGGNASVTVNLIDINDNSPNFTENTYFFTLNNSKDSVIGQIIADDADVGGNGNVTYTLMSSIVEKQDCDGSNEPDLPFSVDVFSGNVTKTSQTPSCQSYRTRVKACDNPTKASERRCTLAELTVTKNATTDVQNLNQTVKVPENSPVGTFIQFVMCSGKDRSYMITDTTVFKINNTGFITPTVVLDRENISSHNFLVEVQDKKSSMVLCNVNVTVNVIDVNDNAPEFNKTSYSFYLPADRVDGQIIGNVQATDLDEGENSRITYAYLNKATSNFDLNETSGEISIQSAAAIATCDVTTLLVVARDNGNPRMESVTQVYIVCHDSNTSVPLSTPLTKTEIEHGKDTFESDISNILNITVKITGIDIVGDSKGGRTRILLTATDTKVQQQDLLEAILLHFEAIRSLFYKTARETGDPRDKDKNFGAAEIALIAMGVVILVGTVLAIVIIQRQFNSHKRYKQLYESLTRNSSLYESQEIKMKMDDETSDYNGSVKSQDLGSMDTPRSPAMATSAINPGFVHDETTVIGQTNLQSSPTDPATNTTVKEVIESLERLSDHLDLEDQNQNMMDVEPSTTSSDVPLVDQADSINEENQTGDSSPVVYANVAMDKPQNNYINVSGFGKARNSIDIPASESIQLTEMNVEAEINHNGTEDNTGDANGTEQINEEPNPDYDVKQVRFHGEVLDADENVLQPLKPAKATKAWEEETPDTVTPESDAVADEDAPPVAMDVDKKDWVEEEMEPPVDTVPEQEQAEEFFFVEDAQTHL